MIELIILFFIAWVDSPEGWQQWQVFTVENKTEVNIACQSDTELGNSGCAYDVPWRWIFIWEPILYDKNWVGRWGCTSILWHELLHAQDSEYGRPDCHGGSLRMIDMPCQI